MQVSQSFRAGVAAFSFAAAALGSNVAAATAAPTFQVLHAFNGTEGLLPQGHLFYDYLKSSPVLVGGLQAGGAGMAGAAYQYNLKTGAVADLYSFLTAPDGNGPTGGVAVGLSKSTLGQIVGVTNSGGANFDGTFYKIAANGTYSLVYSFGSVTNASNPFSPLDGALPLGTPAQAFDGNFYGTASGGGAGAVGTIYKYSPSTNAVTLLYTFGNNPAATNDGAIPLEGLTLAPNGMLYGTTSQGGANGEGAIYSVSTSGVVTTVYSFTGGNDGAFPQCLIAVDLHNNLYGTTPAGGSAGMGVVWKLDSNKNFSVLHTFSSASNGVAPNAGVSFGLNGALFGVTSAGGKYSDGTVFEYDPWSKAFCKLHDFNGSTDGMDPESQLLIGPNGSFYGTAIRGGANGFGTLFNIKV